LRGIPARSAGEVTSGKGVRHRNVAVRAHTSAAARGGRNGRRAGVQRLISCPADRGSYGCSFTRKPSNESRTRPSASVCRVPPRSMVPVKFPERTALPAASAATAALALYDWVELGNRSDQRCAPAALSSTKNGSLPPLIGSMPPPKSIPSTLTQVNMTFPLRSTAAPFIAASTKPVPKDLDQRSPPADENFAA